LRPAGSGHTLPASSTQTPTVGNEPKLVYRRLLWDQLLRNTAGIWV